MDSDFRSRILDAFASLLESRCADARRELEALDEAAANETKSSAGDKYETAREMFAQARDLQRRIREEAESGLAWIDRQRAETSRIACGPGALVETAEGWMLLGPIPVKVEVDGVAVQGVSTQSPLGQAFKGARAGDTVAFRDRHIPVMRLA